jgi:hypothetical protein
VTALIILVTKKSIMTSDRAAGPQAIGMEDNCISVTFRLAHRGERHHHTHERWRRRQRRRRQQVVALRIAAVQVLAGGEEFKSRE